MEIYCDLCNNEIKEEDYEDLMFYIPRSAMKSHDTHCRYCKHCAIERALIEAEEECDITYTKRDIESIKKNENCENTIELAEALEEWAYAIKKDIEFLELTKKDIKRFKGNMSYIDFYFFLEELIMQQNKGEENGEFRIME